MIEELQDYLIRYGWNRDVAVLAHDLYYEANGTMNEMALEGCKAAEDMDDDKHDYSNELFLCIVAWQYEINEREEPYKPAPPVEEQIKKREPNKPT